MSIALVRLRQIYVGLTSPVILSVSLPAAGSDNVVVRALIPSSAFVQAGLGDQNTQSYIGGLTWAPPWQYKLGPTTISGYFEAAFGKWTTKQGGRHSSTWLSQISVTPVLRLHPNGSLHPWFAEIGVGANYIIPIFDTGRKRFSTKFNFGDHIALGRDFGPHELAVRVQHFSNAGIGHPNPGENFVQIRYAYRFGG
jgi:lipid A 3-O-deacylase